MKERVRGSHLKHPPPPSLATPNSLPGKPLTLPTLSLLLHRLSLPPIRTEGGGEDGAGEGAGVSAELLGIISVGRGLGTLRCPQQKKSCV